MKRQPIHILTWLFVLVLTCGFQAVGEETKADIGGQAYKKVKSADKLNREGKVAEAVNAYLDAASMYEKAIDAKPGNKGYKTNLKYCYGKSGYIQVVHAKNLADQGKFQEAVKFYESSVKAFETALKKFPGDKRILDNITYARTHGSKARFSYLLETKGAAPAFSLETFDNGTLNSPDLKGKVVLFEFLTGWCPSCKESMPKLQRLHNKYSGKGLKIVALAMDKINGWAKANSKQKAEESAKGLGFTFAWAVEKNLYDYGAFESIPTVILLDKKGNIARQVPYKEQTEENLSGIIETLLKDQ
ncbi:MAG: TlpA family protein disulfide reductase [bacterium]|nr:TlpA family protein disulfide reductase [bacterium]